MKSKCRKIEFIFIYLFLRDYTTHGTFSDSGSFIQPSSLQEEWGERCSVGFWKQPRIRKRKLIYTPPQLEDSFLFGESEGNEVG